MTFSDQKISEFKELTHEASSIVFVPHQNPDGDAIGSILGWRNVFKSKGVEVKVVVPDQVPLNLQWMSGVQSVVVYEDEPELCGAILKQADLLFFLDFNVLDRCGDMGDIIKDLETPRILIDHHPQPDKELAQIMFSETSVSSTCELSYHILKQLGWQHHINKAAAECFYAGIITDTGVLSYNSSHPETYFAVAEMVNCGIDKVKIHNSLFQSNSFKRMQLLGHALCNKLEVMDEYHTAFISLSKDELDNYNYKQGDTEGFVNYPLNIEGIDISALFTEREKDEFVKISFRSQGSIPINLYSEQFFNGGGHINAAGGEWNGTLSEAIDRFRATLPDFIKSVEI
jgi:phosphoesterase RecJ-like protein